MAEGARCPSCLLRSMGPCSASSCLPPFPWLQESVPLLRKYLGPLDAPLSAACAALSRGRLVCHLSRAPWAAWHAMKAHHSQLAWWVGQRQGEVWGKWRGLQGWCRHGLCLAGQQSAPTSKFLGLAHKLLLPAARRPSRFRRLFMLFSRYTYVNTLRFV